jgi:hypothetical protein
MSPPKTTGRSEHDAQVATSVLVIGNCAAFNSMFNPSIFTTRSEFFHENGAVDENKKSIRIGYAVATVLSIATGWAASTMVKGNAPLWGAVIMQAIEIAGFEWAMAHPAGEGT